MRDLSRLLRPRSIALFGGIWAENVIAQLQKSGFAGSIWPVHPKRDAMRGIPCYRDLDELPGAPDAAFVGINRELTVGLVERLARSSAGGAVCFASGYLESEAEGTGGGELQTRLVKAAGDMPILGPNCYGILNYLDNVTLWPDQHGGRTVESGVAIVLQSSNMAINLTMQRRGLPLAYVTTAGNQAQTGLADIASALLDDPRVTALGLHIEGFGDLRAFEAMAEHAQTLGKPIVALKTGSSAQAKAATMTHTASLAGSAAVSSAFLRRLGIAEARSPAILLETLKLLHFGGPLPGPAIASVSCSGGEASLMADMAEGTRIEFPPFRAERRDTLAKILGPIVTIANPLDYHTFIWGDVERMSACFTAVVTSGFDLVVFVLDLPREDRCDTSVYECAIRAVIAARQATGARVAVLASLTENLPERLAERFVAAGVTPLQGIADGLAAIDAAISAGMAFRRPRPGSPVLIGPAGTSPDRTLNEAEAKSALAACGLAVPRSAKVEHIGDLAAAAATIGYPVALKGLEVAHKTERGAVALDIRGPDELVKAAEAMTGVAHGFLVEAMVEGSLVEVLIGVTADPTGLVSMTLGAGGTLAELLADTATIVLPAERNEIATALGTLRLAKFIAGFRGGPPVDVEAIVDAAMAVARYAQAHSGRLLELDVNPLMVGRQGAVAADALVRLGSEGDRE